jgi:outer membrane biosynthesis protein TonB
MKILLRGEQKMTWESTIKRIGIALLIAISAASVKAGAALSLQIAQAGANETTPGGVEHQPTMEPDAAVRSIQPPPPAMPEAVAPPAPPPAAKPAAPPVPDTNVGSQEKNETKPENPPN